MRKKGGEKPTQIGAMPPRRVSRWIVVVAPRGGETTLTGFLTRVPAEYHYRDLQSSPERPIYLAQVIMVAQ